MYLIHILLLNSLIFLLSILLLIKIVIFIIENGKILVLQMENKLSIQLMVFQR